MQVTPEAKRLIHHLHDREKGHSAEEIARIAEMDLETVEFTLRHYPCRWHQALWTTVRSAAGRIASHCSQHLRSGSDGEKS